MVEVAREEAALLRRVGKPDVVGMVGNRTEVDRADVEEKEVGTA